MAKCNTLAEWLAHEQARTEELLVETEDPRLGRMPLVGPPVRIGSDPGERRPGRRHGSEHGALGGHRIVDLSSFWAGPLAARLLSELGADVVKVEPPGGEGGFQIMPVLPNIYVDGNRSKRGLVLDLKTAEDRARLLDLVAASDVVVENAMAGAWERLKLGEADLRSVNPALVYARAKGFGVAGPLASRPCFDYVVQAATGMEMTQGGGSRPVPVNFTANDYGTGLLLAAGIVLALLGRSMGAAVTTVDASLALTATLFQSEGVALLASTGALPDLVGDELRGPSVGCRLYRARDGWVTVCCVTEEHRKALGRVLGTSLVPGEVPEADGDADGGGDGGAAAGRGRSRGTEPAPLRRSRRPAGRGARAAAALPPPRGGSVRAGRDPTLALGGRARGQGARTDTGASATADEDEPEDGPVTMPVPVPVR